MRGSSRTIAHAREGPEPVAGVPSSRSASCARSRRREAKRPMASTSIAAASMNGRPFHTDSSTPPDTSATPSPISRPAFCTPCERPRASPATRSGYIARYGA
jgi:hypothetical protein